MLFKNIKTGSIHFSRWSSKKDVLIILYLTTQLFWNLMRNAKALLFQNKILIGFKDNKPGQVNLGLGHHIGPG